MVRLSRLAATALAALCLACGGSSNGSPTGPGTGTGGGGAGGSTSTSLSVGDNSFSPSSTTVPIGSVVTWTWNGSAQHNVTFDDGANSATQAVGTYSRTFAAAGTFPYHCTIHGVAMSGTVKVQ